MNKRERNEAIATVLVLIGLVVCIMSALLWRFGVPFEACFSLIYMAAFPMCIGLLWLSLESFKSTDELKKKAVNASGCGFLGLLLLEFIINYGVYKFYDHNLDVLTHIYAIPLIATYLLGCAAYLFSWIKDITKKVHNKLTS